MILQTKNPINHLDLSQIATGGTRQGVVKMVIGSRNFIVEQVSENKFFRKVEVAFVYLDDENKVLPITTKNVFVVEDTEDNKSLVNDSIIDLADTLETSKNFSELYDKTILSFAKREFANRYNITSKEIEQLQS